LLATMESPVAKNATNRSIRCRGGLPNGLLLYTVSLD
jgi:hypothetical protein